ncbi:MAG: Ty1/Copia family ribonuclease HI, partial [Cytophagales bacterium]|nr:Ty1/Copia family ribonuclease HI [Cytophagales bacterium]
MKLAKTCNNPGHEDYKTLLPLMGYLRKYQRFAIKYYPDPEDSPVHKLCKKYEINPTQITDFSDASWMDCPDSRRSTIGNKIFYQGGLIEWASTMPMPIANSSAEAEYMAACLTCMAMTHLSMVVYDLENLGNKDYDKFHTPRNSSNILMIDNKAAVSMAENFKPSKNNRHIERRFHYVRHGQEEKKHKLVWIPKEDQLADDL